MAKDFKEKVKLLLEQNKSHKEIAKIMNTSINAIYNIERELEVEKCLQALESETTTEPTS